MPSRRAVAAPSTATGSRAVAVFRNWPCARLAPDAAGRFRLAASTLRELVSIEGISGDLKTLTLLTVPMSCTSVTPGSRAIMAGAAWQFGGGTADGLPVGDSQEVGAQPGDLGEQACLG